MLDKNKETDQHKILYKLSASGCTVIPILIFIVLVLGMCSCTTGQTVTETKEIPVYIHDTITNNIVKIDSVVTTKHDSIWQAIFTKGDTVYVDKTKIQKQTEYRYKLKHDTAVIIREVEVPVTYTECTEVLTPAKLSKWQKTMIAQGYLFLVSVIASIVLIIYRRTRARTIIGKLVKLIRRK